MPRSRVLLLGLSLLLVAAQAGDTPPPWVDFVSEGGSRLDGEPLWAGRVVRAYDPTGVLAGEFTVPGGDYPAGWYGLMPVYGDRAGTPADEGAEAGDRIAFTVDHFPAIPVGPDSPIWTGDQGTRVRVDLRACTLAGDFDCDCRVDIADIQQVAVRWGIAPGQQGYYPPYDPDGDGIDAADIQRVALVWRGACQ